MPLKCGYYEAGKVSVKGQFFVNRSPTHFVCVCVYMRAHAA